MGEVTDIVERHPVVPLPRKALVSMLARQDAEITTLRADNAALREEVKRLAKRINRQRIRIRFFENCETVTDKFRRRLVLKTRVGARYWDARIKQLNARALLAKESGL